LKNNGELKDSDLNDQQPEIANQSMIDNNHRNYNGHTWSGLISTVQPLQHACSTKVSVGDINNDRQPEMTTEPEILSSLILW